MIKHVLLTSLLALGLSLAKGTAADAPNMIFILADDLGYGELGCYGQKEIQTPNLDRMAAGGMRFTQFYSGATVCAPSRSVLMTGQHHGHTRIRGNAGRQNPSAQALRAEDVTVAKALQEKGYDTALIGKWGLGDINGAESGLPRKQGFAYFYGFLHQGHAHNHYPDFLWRNEEKVPLPNKIVPVGEAGAGYPTEAVQHADELFTAEAESFIKQERTRPFFLYLSYISPHANNEKGRALGDGTEAPSLGGYIHKDWPATDKGHAAMVTHLDEQVGRILQVLEKTNQAQNTLIVFTSDNGPHNESRHNLERFQPSGPYTGIKRSLTEGGIRVPFIAYWPGKVKAGATASAYGYFGDWFATAAELADATTPSGLDSISLVPTLLQNGSPQAHHQFLYWEFHEGGFRQAALYNGRWKGIRSGGPDATIRLYDLENDPAEKQNVVAERPDIAAKISSYLSTARSENPNWEPVWQAKGKGQTKKPE